MTQPTDVQCSIINMFITSIHKTYKNRYFKTSKRKISVNPLVNHMILEYNINKEMIKMTDKTMKFSVSEDKERVLKQNLTIIHDALIEKGYNPINQIVGYILSEDPTYITTYQNARNIIRHIDRDELLQILVKSYIES